MPKRARVHFVSLRSSLVNLPISIYGPLVERSVVSASPECVMNRSRDLFLAPTTSCGSLDPRSEPCEQGEGGESGGVRGMDRDGIRLVPGAFQRRTVG